MAPVSRRAFVVLTGAAIFGRLIPDASAADVPTLLDHILLGSSDLDQGIAMVEKRVGVRAAFGGVHPGRGTRNALLSLGERRYLEIIAPDPKQDSVQAFAAQQLKVLKQLTEPRLVGWAVHPGKIETLATKLRKSNIAIHGPWPGSRARPDGRVLNWTSLNLADDHHGMLPFFIEWATSSLHPSADAPAGCRLKSFAIADPNPAAMSELLQQLGIDVAVEHGGTPQLHARIAGPVGNFDLSS